MALTVNITKIPSTLTRVQPVIAAPASRDSLGRFATPTVAKKVKLAPRPKAPYRFSGNFAVVPFNGGSILATVYSPKLKAAMYASGLVA